MQHGSIKKNSVYNAIKTFSSIIFPLITFPYISRTLLADNVGKINFGMSVISYFTLIASLGITTYAIRECSSVRDNKKLLSGLASQIFSINIITTILSYILLAITLRFCHKFDNYRELIIIQSLSIIFATLGADWINSAMEDFKYITLRTVAFQMISMILMFVFVHRSEDYMKYVIISLGSSSGANILNIWYRKRYCNIRFTTKIEWKRHLIPILLLFVMILAQNIFTNVDTTMLGIMHGDREVGIYSTAQKINNIVSQVVTSILWVIMPRMSYYFAEKNYTEINRLLRKILGFNLLIGLPCAIGVIVIAKDIILIIAGADFVSATVVLQIRTLGFVFELFGGSFLGNAILLPSKQEKYYMIVCLATAGINIITNYIFIPIYGAVAAAGTTAFCSFCILIMLIFRIDRNIKFYKLKKLVISPLVGCLGILLMCMFFSRIPNLVIRMAFSIVSSVIVYVWVQLLFKNELIIEILHIVNSKLRRGNL